MPLALIRLLLERRNPASESDQIAPRRFDCIITSGCLDEPLDGMHPNGGVRANAMKCRATSRPALPGLVVYQKKFACCLYAG
jgi:hypothetical protein